MQRAMTRMLERVEGHKVARVTKWGLPNAPTLASLAVGLAAALLFHAPVVGAEPQANVAPGTERAAAPLGPADPELLEGFERGHARFNQGRYGEAAAEFEAVFLRPDGRGRNGRVAFALGQCQRYMSNFPRALFYYDLAAQAFAATPREQDRPYQSATDDMLRVVSNNLAVVTVQLPPQLAGSGTRLCSLEVDGELPIRHDAGGLRRLLASPGGDTGGQVNSERLQQVALGLERGELAIAKHGSPGPALTPHCHDRDFVLVVDRTVEHELTYEWQTPTGPPRRAVALVSQRHVEPGTYTVLLAREPARLSVQFHDATGKPLDTARADTGKAYLVPVSGGASLSLPEETNEVPPGGYRVRVDSSWVVTHPDQTVSLLPGEQRRVDVALQPRWWTPWRKTGAALGGLGILALGAGTYFALHARDLNGQASEHCRGAVCWDTEGERLSRAAMRSESIARVTAGAGAAALATGLVLVLMGSADERESPQVGHIGLQPLWGEGVTGGQVEGSF